MSKIELYDLPPSPNNTKVRIALGFKGIPFESHPVAPEDLERARIVEMSGQPLTPVIKHGDTVVYDSAAIIRYLEANFPDTPKLMFADRATALEAERVERWARGVLVEPIGMIFGEALSESPSAATCARACERLQELTAETEQRLDGSEWLVGDRMSFVDVTAAPLVGLGLLPEAADAMGPIPAFFRENLRLGEGRERTRAWVGRVMAYDRMAAAAAS